MEEDQRNMVDLAVIPVDRFARQDRQAGWHTRKPLFGHSLLIRVILTAHGAGLERFLILFRKEDTGIIAPLKIERALQKKKIQLTLCPLNSPGGTPRPETRVARHFLLLSDVLVFDPAILDHAGRLQLEPHQSVLYVKSTNGPADSGREIKPDTGAAAPAEAGNPPRAYDDRYAGIAVLPPERFPVLVRVFGKRGGGGLRPTALSDPSMPDRTRFFDIGGHFCQEVTGAEQFRSAEKKLLQSVRKKTDGFVSRNLNRYVSLFISRQLIKIRVSPNQISFANLLIGFLSAWFILLGGHVNFFIGAVLFQLTSIIDGSDGEVAKLTFNCSKYGAWIDTVCDVLTYLVFVLSLPVGLYRYYGDKTYLFLGLSMILSFVVLYTLMTRYMKKTKASGSMMKIMEDMHRQAGEPDRRRGIDRFATKLTFIYRRDFFAFAFLVFCAFGGAWLYMWGLCLLAPLPIIYLYLFSRRHLKP
jgi:CDP-L-myo-inositol myo-inositolphosphotransferase